MNTTTAPTTTRHCESCGSTDAEDLRGEDGYTSCCNECICGGHGHDRFGTPSDYVVACCWAVAEIKFAAQGRQVPDGSSRLS